MATARDRTRSSVRGGLPARHGELATKVERTDPPCYQGTEDHQFVRALVPP